MYALVKTPLTVEWVLWYGNRSLQAAADIFLVTRGAGSEVIFFAKK
jgi:hypothetical protein